MGVAYVDGQARVGRQARVQAQAAGADERRAQTGCRRGRRKRGRHGAWLTAGGQATIEHSKIVACSNNNNTNAWAALEISFRGGRAGQGRGQGGASI